VSWLVYLKLSFFVFRYRYTFITLQTKFGRIFSMNKNGLLRFCKTVYCSSIVILLQSCGVAPIDNESAVTINNSVPFVKYNVPPELNILSSAKKCSGPVHSLPLRQPQEISPNANDILETALVVREKERCVPIWQENKDDPNVGHWEWQIKNLRTYGFPIDHSMPIDPADPNDPNIAWSAPGPTFILNAGSSPEKADGSRFKMILHNYMKPTNDYDVCDTLLDKEDPPQPIVLPPDTPYKTPNCFHGNNVTNFHFHGFHISPQEHQDFVLLNLEPYGSNFTGEHAHGSGDNFVSVGSYKYDVARLRGNQAPGTHWYHAHKHGATAIQVLNGLVGTFEVIGDFDRQLADIFLHQGYQLEDRLMVVQQLDDKLPGAGGTRAAYPLINGQASPKVFMKPGEVQRWRFVGATMQASASLSIGFEEQSNGDAADPQVRQIAMDGVQFAPRNYECQTWINGPDCNPDNLHPGDFTLNPGNRIDLLIQAPATPGTYHMTHRILGNLNAEERDKVERRKKGFIKALETTTDIKSPPLLTLVVEAEPTVAMRFPTTAEFPPIPEYLADLSAPSTPNNKVVYQMSGRTDPGEVEFEINNKKYDPDCVDETLVLDKVEQWQLENNSSAIQHPFHIHINPFQLVSTIAYDADGNKTALKYDPPYVWMDTLALPLAEPPEDASPQNGQAIIRYEAIDFTGAFVDHCHILGHEDRGMMQNVQATCSNGMWGSPTFDGSPECAIPDVPPPLPKCTPVTSR